MTKEKEIIKDLIIGAEARDYLAIGVSKTVDAVGTTLGPKGQHVLIDSGHPAISSVITKDGVTVLRNLQLSNPVQNLAVKTIRDAAEKTVDECGDGTTTTAILAGAIYTNGLKHIAAGVNPVMIKRGIDKVTSKLIDALNSIKRDVGTDSDIRNVATISANGDEEIGSLIVQAMDKVGKDGVVTVENGKSMHDELETTEGLRIDRGYASAYFMTNPTKSTAELNKPLILVTDHEFQTANEVVPFLEMASISSKPILIIADGGSAEALQTMVVNKVKGVVSCCAIDAPGFGIRKKEYLKDLAVALGAEFISDDVGISISQVTKEMLGTCEKVVVSKNDTTFINSSPNKELLDARLEELQSQLSTIDNDYDKEFLKERIAKLTGGVAVIRVGGASEVEVEEKKDRIDDALGATRAAIEGGIVVGGGCALLHAAQKLEMNDLGIKNSDERAGVDIILEAIKQPLKHIVSNAGKSGDYVAETVLVNSVDNSTFGYNAATEEFGDMFEMGIIDPVNVTISALKNGASVATLLLTSKTILMKQNQVTAVRG
jgi:chaperonin GroEL